MQLIRKKVKGQSYWYLVEKGRKNGVVTNVKTVYLGKADRIAQRLGEAEASEADFPKAFQSREIGASAALWGEAKALSLVELINQVCGPRRADAAVSYGELLVTAAIHRAIAPRALKSTEKMRTWYENAGLRDFLPLDTTGLDSRRVHEALSLLRASDIEKMEQEIVGAMVCIHDVSLNSLIFDATNFDSYASASNPSRLLKRGKAKSKRNNLRIMGLGLLVTAEDGLPLLSFVYPGNQPDVRSYSSFLRRFKQRKRTLDVGVDSTIACDGGNVSKDVVRRMETDGLHYIVRLPRGHAPEADALSTDDLVAVKGRLAEKVRAKKLRVKVYGQVRTVVAVYSKSLHESQLPGLERDIDKAKEELDSLKERLKRQRAGKGRCRPLTREGARKMASKVLKRQFMSELFSVSVTGTDTAPVLRYWFKDSAWRNLEQTRFGRTAILTNRDDWKVERIIEALREQNHAEHAFKQMKDPEWASAVPLRHRTDATLRIHAFISVLGLLLSMLVVRHLKNHGVQATVSEALWQLSEIRVARVSYGSTASPLLQLMAKQHEVPPEPTPRQLEIVRALSLSKAVKLGPTRKPRKRLTRAD